MARETLLYAVKSDLSNLRAFTEISVRKTDQVGTHVCVVFEESCRRRR